jgi:hypothetical protein
MTDERHPADCRKLSNEIAREKTCGEKQSQPLIVMPQHMLTTMSIHRHQHAEGVTLFDEFFDRPAFLQTGSGIVPALRRIKLPSCSRCFRFLHPHLRALVAVAKRSTPGQSFFELAGLELIDPGGTCRA